MIATFQYRLYPTREQEIVLENTLQTCRHLYNGSLAQRLAAYRYEGKTIGFVEQANQLPRLKETAQPLADLYSKAENAAKTVVEVCPRNTSQNCSRCGEYVPKALSCRTHTCPYCGLVLHRDKNAAENVRKNGRVARLQTRDRSVCPLQCCHRGEGCRKCPR